MIFHYSVSHLVLSLSIHYDLVWRMRPAIPAIALDIQLLLLTSGDYLHFTKLSLTDNVNNQEDVILHPHTAQLPWDITDHSLFKKKHIFSFVRTKVQLLEIITLPIQHLNE